MKGRQGIVLEPQLPKNFRTGTESIQKLEENMYKREEILPEDEEPNPPRFTVELKVDILITNMAILMVYDNNSKCFRMHWMFKSPNLFILNAE